MSTAPRKPVDPEAEIARLQTELIRARKEKEDLQQELLEKVEGRTRELAEARDLAEAANQAKSRFLANMSHEIRSPLNAILGFAQILMSQEKDLQLPANFRKYLNNIRVSGENLSEIINDILDLSKIEAGRMTLLEEDLNLRQLVQGIYHIYKSNATEKGIDYNYAFGKGLPEVISSDRTKIKQILMNLISNALKFTPAGRSVRIFAGTEGDWLVLQVTDKGIGIPKDRLNSIFDPFVQADSATTRKFGGTGLGLAITQKMVELLGGTIQVESQESVGSEFTVKLPLIKAQSKAFSEEAIYLGQLDYDPSNVVLVVEDNPMNRDMIQALFGELGLHVKLAENGEEGIRKAYDLKPDLILMDIHMPIMDGLECTRRIRLIPECSDIPIVALSADAFKEQQRRAFEVGMTDYLPKPLNLSRLIPILNKTLKPGNASAPPPKGGEKLTGDKKGDWNRIIQSLLTIPIYETEQLVAITDELEGLSKNYNAVYIDTIEQLRASIYNGDSSQLETVVNQSLNE